MAEDRQADAPLCVDHVGPTPTTYLDTGTPENAALATAAYEENVNEDPLIRVSVDLCQSPMYLLAVRELREAMGFALGDGQTEEDSASFPLRLFATRMYLAGRIAGKYGWDGAG